MDGCLRQGLISTIFPSTRHEPSATSEWRKLAKISTRSQAKAERLLSARKTLFLKYNRGWKEGMNMGREIVGPDRIGTSIFERSHIVRWLRDEVRQQEQCNVPSATMLEAFKQDLDDLGVNIEAFARGIGEEAGWTYVRKSDAGFHFSKGTPHVQSNWSRNK